MSEQTEAAPEATENTATNEPEPFDPERAKAKIEKANNEAKNLRARLKELEPLAAKVKELEDRDKTEAERQAEALATVQKERDNALAELARFQVGVKYQLNDEDLESLRDVPADAMERIAARMAAKAADNGPRKPAPNPQQGTGSDTALNGDPLLQSLKSTLGIP